MVRAGRKTYHINGEVDPLAPEGAELLAPILPCRLGCGADGGSCAAPHASLPHAYGGAISCPAAKTALAGAAPHAARWTGARPGAARAGHRPRRADRQLQLVTRIEADAGAVTGLTCLRGGQSVTLRAKRYILAAAALARPRSCCVRPARTGPRGWATATTLSGRNLMFHLSEIIAIWAGQQLKSERGRALDQHARSLLRSTGSALAPCNPWA